MIVEGDRLFVAQPWDRRLRVYSSLGDFIGFIGRDGEGPGEFRSVDGIGLHGGLVWIHDSDLQRLQYFDTEGRFVSSGPWAVTRVYGQAWPRYRESWRMDPDS